MFIILHGQDFVNRSIPSSRKQRTCVCSCSMCTLASSPAPSRLPHHVQLFAVNTRCVPEIGDSGTNDERSIQAKATSRSPFLGGKRQKWFDKVFQKIPCRNTWCSLQKIAKICHPEHQVFRVADFSDFLQAIFCNEHQASSAEN